MDDERMDVLKMLYSRKKTFDHDITFTVSAAWATVMPITTINRPAKMRKNVTFIFGPPSPVGIITTALS